MVGLARSAVEAVGKVASTHPTREFALTLSNLPAYGVFGSQLRIRRNPMVKPIPDGAHSIMPTLLVKDARKAIAFYKKALGAK
jgi:hypothetical protein